MATPERTRRGSPWAVASIVGGAAVVVAPLLPWVSASSPTLGTASLSGFEAGRGVVVAVGAGIVAAGTGAVLLLAMGGRGGRRLAAQLGVVAALAAAAVGWIAYRDAADPAVSLLVSRDDAAVTYAPGIGVWVLILGAVFVIAGSVGAGSRRRRPGRSKVRDTSEETV